MSLINDMLRDLDSRNAASTERSGLAQNIRALPHKNERRLHPLLLALVAAGAGGTVVWLLLQPTAPTTPATPPVLAAAPAVAAPSPPPSEPDVAETATAAPAAPSNLDTATLRLDTQLDKPPTAQPAPQLPATQRPTEALAPQPKAAPPVRAAVSTTAARPTETAQPQISKQVVVGTSAEQAESDYRRGIAAIRRGDTTEAGEALRSALRLAPAHIAARQALLGQLTEQQRWADAETLALDGVSLLPQRSEWALLAARLMYERGEADLALETLNQHAAAARQNADYQILHALLLQRAGRHADAANCYRTALAQRPNEGRWWFGLGRALDADRREGEARQAYEKARDSGNLPVDLQQNVERRLRQT